MRPKFFLKTLFIIVLLTNILILSIVILLGQVFGGKIIVRNEYKNSSYIVNRGFFRHQGEVVIDVNKDVEKINIKKYFKPLVARIVNIKNKVDNTDINIVNDALTIYINKYKKDKYYIVVEPYFYSRVEYKITINLK